MSYDLYGGLPPHQKVDTSKNAAMSMLSKAGVIREEVFNAIGDGSTCDEVEQTLDLKHQTASPRLRELAQTGRIRDSGARRLTRSGRKAIVWVVA